MIYLFIIIIWKSSYSVNFLFLNQTKPTIYTSELISTHVSINSQFFIFSVTLKNCFIFLN